MKSWFRKARGCAALCALLLCGCPAPSPECIEGDEPTCPDAGGPPPDVCNSAQEALSDASCELALGQVRQAFISFGGDQDWYLARMPALTPRSLVHLSGGYGAPATAVNLSLTLLAEDGKTSLAQKVDRHGQAAPRPVDIILPFSQSNAKLLVLVGDEAGTAVPRFDVKNPYSVKIEVVENPDPNEPNDQTPTVIPLAQQGATLAGQVQGQLATDDDVDRFKFTAPAGRKVIHLRLTAPKMNPPPPYRLSYTLYEPSGRPVSEGVVQNEFLAVDLATARLSTAGDWTVVVQGYKSPNTSTTVPGDIRPEAKYTLAIAILDEVDATEPNDTLANARVAAIGAPGGSQSWTGRIGYVPDPDWFAVDLGPLAEWSVLQFDVRPGAGGGRFPPLSTSADRQLRVLAVVAQGAQTCKMDPNVCPKGYEGSQLWQSQVEGMCDLSPAQCLLAERNEHVSFANLRNFEGRLPVPPHAASLRYYVVVQDEGNNWADDRDYTLTVRWLDDPDEAAAKAPVTLPQTTSYPSPSPAAEVSGDLSHGYGRVVQHDVNRGDGVRAPEDYDAVPSDVDRYQFDFPAGLTTEQSWALEWEILHLPDGGLPADLALELEFCDADADGGATGCATVSRGLVLAYSPDRLAPWYSQSLADRTVLYERNRTATSTTVRAAPAGCFCYESRFVRGGRYYAKVLAVDRKSHEPVQYRVRSAYASYPQGFTTDGGARTCPVSTDGGPSCRFTGGASN